MSAQEQAAQPVQPTEDKVSLNEINRALEIAHKVMAQTSIVGHKATAWGIALQEILNMKAHVEEQIFALVSKAEKEGQALKDVVEDALNVPKVVQQSVQNVKDAVDKVQTDVQTAANIASDVPAAQTSEVTD